MSSTTLTQSRYDRAQNGSPRTNRLLIAIMGATGSGKSSLVKGITGRQDIKIGHSLYSETDEIHAYDTIVNSQPITLVDTPGFDDSVISDLEILKKLAEWLKVEYEEGQLLTGIVYLHPITRTRMEGSTLRTLNIIKKLCGEQNLKNAVLVTTFWNHIDQQLGERREQELLKSDDFWKTLVEHGSKSKRISENYESFKSVLVEMAKCPTMKLQIQEEMQEGKPLEETMAGLFINEERQFVWVDGEQTTEPEPDEWWSDYFSKINRESEEADERKKQRDAEIAKIKEREEQEAARLKASLELKEQVLRGQKAEAERKLKEAAENQRKKQQYLDEERAALEEKQARARREAISQTAYQESLIQRSSVSADVDLIRAAAAADYLRINVAGINQYGIGMENDGGVTRSGINSWCDRCRQCIGAREVAVCEICPPGLGGLTICVDCYSKEDGKVCMNEDHELFRSEEFVGDNCRRAVQGGVLDIICDRQDCRRPMKGFYFHCCTCDDDDFDICLQCVLGGRGCRNGSHWLRWAVVPIDIRRTPV